MDEYDGYDKFTVIIAPEGGQSKYYPFAIAKNFPKELRHEEFRRVIEKMAHDWADKYIK